MKVLVITFEPNNDDNGSNHPKSAAQRSTEKIQSVIVEKLDPIIPGTEIFTHVQNGKPNVITIIQAKMQIDQLRPDAVLFVTTNDESNIRHTTEVCRFTSLDKETVLKDGKLVKRPTLPCLMKKSIKRATATGEGTQTFNDVQLCTVEMSKYSFLPKSVSGNKLFGWIRLPSQLRTDLAEKSILASIHAMLIHSKGNKAHYTLVGRRIIQSSLSEEINWDQLTRKTSKKKDETQLPTTSPKKNITDDPLKMKTSPSNVNNGYRRKSLTTSISTNTDENKCHQQESSVPDVKQKITTAAESRSVEKVKTNNITTTASSKKQLLVPAIRKPKIGIASTAPSLQKSDNNRIQKPSLVRQVSWREDNDWDVSTYCPDEDEWDTDSYSSLESETSEDWEHMFW